MAVTKFEKPMGTEVQSLSEQIETLNSKITFESKAIDLSQLTWVQKGSVYKATVSKATYWGNKNVVMVQQSSWTNVSTWVSLDGTNIEIFSPTNNPTGTDYYRALIYNE